MRSPQQSRTRVLHVITVLSVGGVEVWLIELLKHMRSLAEAGHQVEQFDILMTGGARDELDDLAASLGANLHYLYFSRRSYWSFAKGFRKLLGNGDYAAIHDHQDVAAGWHLIAAGRKLPPLRVVHVHNAPARLRAAGRTKLRRALLRLSGEAIRRHATHVLGTSSQILRDYGFLPESLPRQEVRTLHCGFDVRPFAQSHDAANDSLCDELGWERGSRIALFVGRLEGFDESNPGWNGKNPEFALRVAKAAIDGGCDMRLVMVGGGDGTKATLEGQLRESGHSNRIRLVGKRNDVPRIMAGSHVLLFPSLEEGLGMVAVEAQAAGLRVIASDTVSSEAAVIPELVTFLSLTDALPVWTNHLVEAIGAPRFDAVEASRRISESPFSIAHSYEHLHSIYSSVEDARP